MEADLSEFLSTLSFPKLVDFMLEQFSREDVDEDLLDETFDYFLFIGAGGHTPDDRYSIVTKYASTVKNPKLLELVATSVYKNYNPEIFLEALNILAATAGLEEQICSKGLIKHLVISMSKDSKISRSQSLGARIICSLCVVPIIRNFLVTTQVVTRLVEALKNHPKDEIVVLDVFKALVNLSNSSKKGRRRLAVEALDLILELIESQGTNSQIVLLGLSILQNISSGDLDETVKHKLSFCVLNAMTRHISVRDIQIKGAWIFVKLMTNNSEAKDFVVERGAHHDIMAMLTEYSLQDQVEGKAKRKGKKREVQIQLLYIDITKHRLYTKYVLY
eukprot:TRINITY_DN4711_c0_g1_i1.p1 TRINITY_DN4711_c0_g1~~TRINITY_DN4711_c0_g1_i1.p1  ORF type:complete len:345 (+),score=56.22 TRINITY_DN4711_c0_g1_i1:39-1037(+)